MKLGPLSRAALIADLGEHAALRFVDFVHRQHPQPHTRAAYAVAVRGFFHWLEKHGPAISPESARITSPPMSRYWPKPTKPDGETAPRGDTDAPGLDGDGRRVTVQPGFLRARS